MKIKNGFSAVDNVSSSASLRNYRPLMALFCALILSRILGSLALPLYDDAFITFRYARNLGQGFGFVYQPGHWVMGLTGPAFGFVLSLISFLSLDLPRVVVPLNILTDVFIFWVTYKLLNVRLSGTVTTLFGIFFGSSPIMTRICAGGMEMDLFLLMSVLTIYLYINDRKRLALFLAGLSYFIRPESVVLIGVVVAMEWVVSKKNALMLLISSLIIILPLLLIQYYYYGSVLSQPVLSKSREVGVSVIPVVKELLFTDILCIVVAPFACYGAIKAYSDNIVVRILTWWALIYAAAYLIVRPSPWSWYGEPIHYVELVLAAIGISEAGRSIKSFVAYESHVWWIGSAGVAVLWAGIFVLNGPSKVNANVYREIKIWSKEANRSKNSILAGDIGAIGYYSSSHILDAAGLVWPEAINYQSTRDLAIIYHPDYIFLNATRSNMEMMTKHPLDTLYVPVRRFSANKRIDIDPLPLNYGDQWVQDYLLFSRRTL